MSRSLASLADLVQRLKIYPLVDSAELFFYTLDREQKRILRRYGVVKPCCRCWGSWRLIITRPSRQVLRRLDYLASKYRGVLRRVDVALEIGCDPDHRERLHSWIVSHAVLRHRRRGPMHVVKGTIYWCSWKKRSRSNLVAYCDRINRVTGELYCCHLELRLERTANIRSHGIHRVADLLAINPRELFARHIIWSDAGERYVKAIIRKNPDCNWIPRLLQVLGYDVAQKLKDIFPRSVSKAKKLEWLSIPTTLDWPPTASPR